MNRLKNIFYTVTRCFFILLFCYAALTKLLDFENFQIELAQSPLLSAYASLISYSVIIIELLIVLALIFPRFQLLGLYASFGIMISFTIYIYLLLNYSEYVPCSCGGILEKLTWEQHMLFNIICVFLALCAILFQNNPIFCRKVLLKLSFVALASILIVVLLFFQSEHVMKKENNFTRRFRPHIIDREKKLDLAFNSFYFAGQKGDTIFLGNEKAPLLIGTILPDFTKLSIDTLDISDKTLPFQNVHLQVNYPYFSISDGNVPALFRGKFPNKKAELLWSKQAYYHTINMVTQNRFVFRGQTPKTGENNMKMLITEPKDTIIQNNTFLEKQVDGIFDTDGSFITDPKNQNTIYTYFYRNEYRVLDSLLQFKTKGKTIDTTTTAQIQIIKTKDNTKKLGQPPLMVNEQQTAYNGILFNVALLRGKHESDELWKNSKIVDVYNYLNNTYLYSFKIKNINHDKMRQILVTSKHVYVLIGSQILRYQRMH